MGRITADGRAQVAVLARLDLAEDTITNYTSQAGANPLDYVGHLEQVDTPGFFPPTTRAVEVV